MAKKLNDLLMTGVVPFVLPNMCFWNEDSEGGGDAGGDGDDTGGEFQMPDWANGLSEENKAMVSTKKWVNVDAAFDSHRSAEAAFSGRETIPTAESSVEDTNAFYEKMGKPAEAKGYEFSVPEDLPEGLPYDTNLAETFRAGAHELNLTAAQGSGVHDMFVNYQVAAHEAHEQQVAEAATAGADALAKEPGWSGDNTGKNLSAIKEMLTQHGGAELADLVGGENFGSNAPLLKFLHNVRESLGEDALRPSGERSGGNLKAIAAKMAKLEVADAPLHDKKHPDHQQAVDEWNALRVQKKALEKEG